MYRGPRGTGGAGYQIAPAEKSPRGRVETPHRATVSRAPISALEAPAARLQPAAQPPGSLLAECWSRGPRGRRRPPSGCARRAVHGVTYGGLRGVRGTCVPWAPSRAVETWHSICVSAAEGLPPVPPCVHLNLKARGMHSVSQLAPHEVGSTAGDSGYQLQQACALPNPAHTEGRPGG